MTVWERIKAFFAHYGSLVALGLGIVAALVFKAKVDEVGKLQARIRLLTLEKELGKLEMEAKKNAETFKNKLDYYNSLKSEHADIVKRLSLGSST